MAQVSIEWIAEATNQAGKSSRQIINLPLHEAVRLAQRLWPEKHGWVDHNLRPADTCEACERGQHEAATPVPGCSCACHN